MFDDDVMKLAAEIEQLKAERLELKEALWNLIPAACWFFEGPYGATPDIESLYKARELVKDMLDD